MEQHCIFADIDGLRDHALLDEVLEGGLGDPEPADVLGELELREVGGGDAGELEHRATGGHLDPTMFAAFAPHVLPLTVEEGIANGVAPVRRAMHVHPMSLSAFGLMLGAVYMATDLVSSPLTQKGIWIYSIGIGVLVVLIRVWGGLPEGVMYAILLMNAATPLINRFTRTRVYGYK